MAMTARALELDLGDGPRRIQRRRARGWRMPARTIYVGRPTKWGNPYTVDSYRADWPDASEDALRAMAVSDYLGLIEGAWDRLGDPLPPRPTIDEIRAALAGYNLACWCPIGSPCHADVLLAIANETGAERVARGIRCHRRSLGLAVDPDPCQRRKAAP